MKIIHRNWHNVIEGIFIGCALSVALLAIVDLGLFDRLGDYGPSAMAGLFTILAAYFALKGVVVQLRTQELHVMQQRKTSNRARRAALALDLSSLSVNCEDRVSHWHGVIRSENRHDEAFDLNNIGQISAAQIENFVKLIEVSDGNNCFYIAKMLQDYQVCTSRDRSHEYDGNMFHAYQRFIDWHIMRIIVDNIFDYQRFDSEFIAIPSADRLMHLRLQHRALLNREGFEQSLSANVRGTIQEYTEIVDRMRFN